MKSGSALKAKARPVAHKKAKPEPKKPDPKKVPLKPPVKFVAKPAPKLPVKVAIKEPMKQSPAVKRVDESKKPVAKLEPARAALGKEPLKVPGKLDPKAKKNGAVGPDGAQPAAPTGKEESDAPLLDL